MAVAAVLDAAKGEHGRAFADIGKKVALSLLEQGRGVHPDIVAMVLLASLFRAVCRGRSEEPEEVAEIMLGAKEAIDALVETAKERTPQA